MIAHVIIETMAEDVAEYLRHIKKENVRACQVTIGRQTCIGARYTQVNHYTERMSCVVSGIHKAGRTYLTERFYLLMRQLPKKAVYVIEGGEWYVSSWYDHQARSSFHPFGNMFSLNLWDASEKMDNDKPRIPLVIEYC